MTRNDRRARMRKLAVDDMQIGSTNAAGVDLHQKLSRRGERIVDARELECRVRRFENHGVHRDPPLLVSAPPRSALVTLADTSPRSVIAGECPGGRPPCAICRDPLEFPNRMPPATRQPAPDPACPAMRACPGFARYGQACGSGGRESPPGFPRARRIRATSG